MNVLTILGFLNIFFIKLKILGQTWSYGVL